MVWDRYLGLGTGVGYARGQDVCNDMDMNRIGVHVSGISRTSRTENCTTGNCIVMVS